MSTRDDPTERLRKALRAQLREGDASIAVGRDDLQQLLDELGRLAQSSERLRRQNRRLRLRCQRAGIGADEESADEGGDDRGVP